MSAADEIEYVIASDTVTGERLLFEHGKVPAGWVPSTHPFRMDDVVERDVNSNGKSRSTALRTGWVGDVCEQLKARSWADVLLSLHFTHSHDRDGVSYWTRPGKDKRPRALCDDESRRQRSDDCVLVVDAAVVESMGRQRATIVV